MSVAPGGNGVNPLLAAALDYAARGWRVFPCNPRGKVPATEHGFKDATTDPATIAEWWRRRPDANVAIATGAVSGLVVLDIDPDDGGGDGLAALEAEHGPLPDGPEVQTGGGRHVYLTCPPGGLRSLRAVGGRRGVELKADGAYVVAPPSVHPSGRPYAWDALFGPETPLPPVPAWLAAEARPDQPRAGGAAPTDGESVKEGQRNLWLTSRAGAVRRHGFSEAAILALLLEENAARCEPPLAEVEVRAIAASISRYEPDPASRGAEGSAPQAEIVCLADVQPEPVCWLWPGRLPLGKVAIIDGDPGLGKSLLALDIAARVTTGREMPDGTSGDLDEPAGVVLLSAEDDPADTILPRLLAAGADVARVVLLTGVSELRGAGERAHREVRPPTVQDAAHIRQAIERVSARLLVIDPIMAYTVGDTHVDADVRRGLALLAELVRATRVAAVVVRHLNKTGGANPLYRGGGSIAFIAAARVGLLVADDPDDPEGNRRVLAVTKSNLAALPPSLAYGITTTNEGVARIEWLGSTRHRAADLLTPPGDAEDRPALTEAEVFLRELLADGPVAAREVEDQARAAGIRPRTLERAKARLGVVSGKSGGHFGGPLGWTWRLPDQPDNLKGAKGLKIAKDAIPGDLGDLQANGALQVVRSAAKTSDPDRCA